MGLVYVRVHEREGGRERLGHEIWWRQLWGGYESGKVDEQLEAV